VPGATPEVLVMGGGPAGAAAARLLALWGHDVLLIAKPHATVADLPESLPPSTRKLFDVLGVLDAIDRAGFIRSTGNTVWWGSDARVEPFAGGGLGWQVTSRDLSRVLLEAASTAGAAIEWGTADTGSARSRGCMFTLDCTGRAGLVAREERLRVSEPGHQTVAMVGRWARDAGFGLPDPTHTVIESYGDGWAWSVPLAAGGRAVAVMVDRGRSNLARDRAAREIYDLELAKTVRFRELLAGAALIDGPTGWDASMYFSTRYVAGDRLLVGDAASFIDPLSSAGVKKALASAWLAAVTVHTCLIRPAMRETALAFYEAREADVYSAFRALTARHLAAAASAHGHPFWDDRPEPEGGGDDRAQIDAAYSRLREREPLRLRQGRGVDTVLRPAVHGREIVLEPRLVAAGDPQGLRFVADVDLLVLVARAPQAASVPDLFAAYSRHTAPVGWPEFLTALSTAIARGFLEWDDE
jgi:flavin-dependent dehydrogenase